MRRSWSPAFPGAARTPALVVWAKMTPIDFSGEDTSLTQANLAALK
ncbi:MAG TPA: hypothetical protein VMH40_10660 [Myxococcaceae bacterium]|nr:hypothetical protein [Myxococcaceae bacterium]